MLSSKTSYYMYYLFVGNYSNLMGPASCPPLFPLLYLGFPYDYALERGRGK